MDAFDDVAQEFAELDDMARNGIAGTPSGKLIATYVPFLRSMLGWKQDALASFAGVSLSSIQRIERGEAVSAASLNKVASALMQPAGAFTEPRVPLTSEEATRKLEQEAERLQHTVIVPVRRLKTQPQIADIAKAHCFFVDTSRLGSAFDCERAVLGETLESVSFFLMSEEKGSIFHVPRQEPVKRRELYTIVLDLVRRLEHDATAVALAGTYQAQTEVKIFPSVEVGLVTFFPKRTDPGAVKRKALLAPARVDIATAWRKLP